MPQKLRNFSSFQVSKVKSYVVAAGAMASSIEEKNVRPENLFAPLSTVDIIPLVSRSVHSCVNVCCTVNKAAMATVVGRNILYLRA